MSNEKKMFGKYERSEMNGINPPYAPAYPARWGFASAKCIEITAKVDREKISEMFAMGVPPTPFTMEGDRALFRFIKSNAHTMSSHNPSMFDFNVTVAVRYKDYITKTNLHMYNSDTIMIMAGREVLGYPEKDARFGFNENEDKSISGWVNRRGYPIADFTFTPDSNVNIVGLTDGDEPKGEVHVRRVPDFSKPGTVYSDIVYRESKAEIESVVPGRASMNLYGSKYDPLSELKPTILSARYLEYGAYDGEREKRVII